jgi:hypothetical protein
VLNSVKFGWTGDRLLWRREGSISEFQDESELVGDVLPHKNSAIRADGDPTEIEHPMWYRRHRQRSFRTSSLPSRRLGLICAVSTSGSPFGPRMPLPQIAHR